MLTVRLAATAMALIVWPSSATAAFPGSNGPLVIAQGGCNYEIRYLSRMPWRGGDLTPITDPCDQAEELGDTSFDIFSPTVSPDGHTILAVQHDVGLDGNGTGDSFTTVQLDGSDRRTIPFPHTGSAEDPCCASDPTFAPNGERFAFSDAPSGERRFAVWEMRLDGSDAKTIHRRPACGRRESCSFISRPSWSPDGKLIAVVVRTNGRKDPPLKAGIWLMRAKNGEFVRRVAKRGSWLGWSPDGRKLVYATDFRRSQDGTSGGNLFVVNRNGESTRSLVHRSKTAELDPVWSPDGKWIAWVSMRYNGVHWDPTIRRVRVAGGRVRAVKKLSTVFEIDGFFEIPELAWVARGE